MSAEPKPVTCDLCGWTADSVKLAGRIELASHVELDHGGTCESCGFTLKTRTGTCERCK